MRDGQRAVVGRDLKTAHIADGIAPTLQAALDDWPFIAPQPGALYEDPNSGQARLSILIPAAAWRRRRRLINSSSARQMAPAPATSRGQFNVPEMTCSA